MAANSTEIVLWESKRVKHRLKIDKDIKHDDLKTMWKNVMRVSGSNDLVGIFSEVRDKGHDDSTSQVKIAPTIACLHVSLEQILISVPNTRLPKKLNEVALMDLNTEKRWAFDHKRLCDQATDLTGWVRVLLTKLREIAKDRDIYRRVCSACTPMVMEKIDKLIPLVVVDSFQLSQTMQVEARRKNNDGTPSIFDEVVHDDFDFDGLRKSNSMESLGSDGSLCDTSSPAKSAVVGTDTVVGADAKSVSTKVDGTHNKSPVVVLKPLAFSMMDAGGPKLATSGSSCDTLVAATIHAGANLAGGAFPAPRTRCAQFRTVKC